MKKKIAKKMGLLTMLCSLSLSTSAFAGNLYSVHESESPFALSAMLPILKDTEVREVGDVYMTSPAIKRIKVNEQERDIEGYQINKFHYFKLRDLASILNETEKNFNVTYNPEKKIVEIFSMMPYQSVIQKNNHTNIEQNIDTQQAIYAPQSIYLDGKSVTIKSYSIAGCNYCDLYDLAELLNFAVDYRMDDNTLEIDTNRNFADSVVFPLSCNYE